MKALLSILIFAMTLPICSATFSADRVEEACRSYLLQKYSQDCQVTFLTPFEDISIENADIKAVFDENYTKSNQGVKLDFTANNKIILSKIYNFNIKKEIITYKAKDYLPAHTTITNSMVIQENEYVDLAELDKHINPIGRVVKNPIYKKEPLTSDNTLPDLAIKRGDKVVVIASNGTVTIRGMGTAMEDGRVGETIRVKRENSKKLLTGKINESGELILGD